MKISYIKYIIKILLLVLCFVNFITAQVTDTIHVEHGWNLLSIPVKIGDVPISIIFPNAVSDAFLYEDGYIHKDSVNNEVGFWLKYDTAETIILTGTAIHRDTVNVREGWNIIGSITKPVAVNTIFDEPPGIIKSEYFCYTTEVGYQAIDTIYPSKGSWVKASQEGAIIFTSIEIPCPGMRKVIYDDKSYNTIQIGNQCWLKENLDVGTMIQGIDTFKNNGIIEKHCYNDEVENCNIYGGLYNWNEAMKYISTEGYQGICPIGWHIPTLAEFKTLKLTVNNDGNALKSIGQGTGEGAGTNTSGFSALLSGFRYDYGFRGMRDYALFWISTKSQIYDVFYMILYRWYNYIYLHDSYNDESLSVRCLKD